MSPVLNSRDSKLTYLSGIYVPNDERWPEHFRGIGIRIEDSVCVGDEHPIVLTMEAVKEVFHLATDLFGRYWQGLDWRHRGSSLVDDTHLLEELYIKHLYSKAFIRRQSQNVISLFRKFILWIRVVRVDDVDLDASNKMNSFNRALHVATYNTIRKVEKGNNWRD